jgi:hypothetical protein
MSLNKEEKTRAKLLIAFLTADTLLTFFLCVLYGIESGLILFSVITTIALWFGVGWWAMTLWLRSKDSNHQIPSGSERL